MKTTRRKIIFTLLSLIVAGVMAAPQYMYFSGLNNVPDDRSPLHHLQLPSNATNVYWRFLGGNDAPQIRPKNPDIVILDFFWPAPDLESHRMQSAEYRLLGEAARAVMFRQKFFGDWHLSNASALIWISRKWTVDEALSTVLLDSYFGNGLRGLENASRGYFDTALADISDAQVVYLLVIRAAPTRYEPWCNSDTHRKRFELFADKLGYSVAYDKIAIMPAPHGTCE